MSPRLPPVDGSQETTTFNCLRISYDKYHHNLSKLTPSDILPLAASCVVGAVAFPLCLGVLQKFVFASLGVSSVVPLGDMLGACAVAVSGLTATQITANVWSHLRVDSNSQNGDRSPAYTTPEEMLIISGVSLAVFVLMRGKVRSVLPSNVLAAGVFAKGSLPASEKYATGSQRLKLYKIGKRHGCHSCGSRYFVQDFIADHQPPLAVLKMQQSPKRPIFDKVFRLFRAKSAAVSPRQQFYPQCNSCSVKQLTYLSAASRGLKRPSPVVTHGSSLRLRHIFIPLPLLLVSTYRFCAFRD